MSRIQAILVLACAALLFSTSGVLIKVITIGPLALVSARSLVAAVAIGIYLRRPRLTWSLPQIGGAASLVLAQVFFVIATRETTAANAIFIQFTAPVFAAIFGIWFLGERARYYDWLTMAFIGFGLYLFFSGEFSWSGALGDIYALLSGIALAWLVLCLRKQKDSSPTETVFLGNVLAGIVGLPFLVTGAPPTPADWAGILFLGVFQIGLGFVLLSIVVKYLEAVETMLIQTLEPVFNPIWVFLAIREAPTPLELAGGVVVLVTVTARGILAGRQSSQTLVTAMDVPSAEPSPSPIDR